MGTARPPRPVKLICSIISGDPALPDAAQERLEALYGPVDFRSSSLPFDHTDYYTPEMGPGLERRIVAFAELVDPGRLAEIKLQTNALEQEWAVGGRRRVNLDPGYVSLSKLVLATTKNHGHRIYLGQGIYAEVTLVYREGSFRPWPWTYPDYASPSHIAIFNDIRRRYREQLRGEFSEQGL